MPVPPCAMRGEVREAVMMAPVDAIGLTSEGRGEPATACRIRSHACNIVTPVGTLSPHVRLRRIGLEGLLPRQSALMTRTAYLFASLRSLCCREMPQLTVLSTPQCMLGAQLLARRELPLALSLQVGLSLRVRLRLQIRFCLHGRLGLRSGRLLMAALGLWLPLLIVPLLLNVPLLLLNAAGDDRRRLPVRSDVALRRSDLRPCDVRRCRPCKTRSLRPRDMRRSLGCRHARRCNMGCRTRGNVWCRRPCGRSSRSCRRGSWRSAALGLVILGGSRNRNGGCQRGCQRQSSSHAYHCYCPPPAEPGFRRSTG